MRAFPITSALLILACCGCGTGASTSAPDVPTAEASSEPKAIDDPNHFLVKFETTKGDFVIAVAPSWAPLGAARFRELVEAGYYDDCRLFRVVPGYVVQFGINGDPAVTKKWNEAVINDDPVVASNTRGRISFATSGPNSRTTQVFINYRDNSKLDSQGFVPFGEVVEGMDVVGSLDATHGEAPTSQQKLMQEQGNAYLDQRFPKLDSIKKARIIGGPGAPKKSEQKTDETPQEGSAAPEEPSASSEASAPAEASPAEPSTPTEGSSPAEGASPAEGPTPEESSAPEEKPANQ